MGETTDIAWARSTFNPWWGCTKVAPGCDNCYAEKFAKRVGHGDTWGTNSDKREFGVKHWEQPMKWNKKAETEPDPWRVFCGSMCDWADKTAPELQRYKLWQLIRYTPALTWLLLTKRAPNIKRYLPEDWRLNGSQNPEFRNVWLGVTVENRKHGLARIEHLRLIPATVRFLSIEPLLEDLGDLDLTDIDWVIVGGESGPGHREMNPLWVVNIYHQCQDQGVPFFFKQWGGRTPTAGGCELMSREIKEFPS